MMTEINITEPEDIDPAQWLTASSEPLTDFVVTNAGRLKIAALTEKETETIRKSSEVIDPRNPRGPRTLNLTKMRCATVAFSLNKAYGYSPQHPSFLTPERLNPALTGEITNIVTAITKLSGFKEEDQGSSPDAIFQVS